MIRRAYCIQGAVIGVATGVVMVTPAAGDLERPCLVVEFSNGAIDYIPFSEVGGSWQIEWKDMPGDNCLEELKRLSDDLEKQANEKISFESMEADIQKLVATCVDYGRHVWIADDRNHIRAMIAYWISVLRSISKEERFILTPRLLPFEEQIAPGP